MHVARGAARAGAGGLAEQGQAKNGRACLPLPDAARLIIPFSFNLSITSYFVARPTSSPTIAVARHLVIVVATTVTSIEVRATRVSVGLKI
jgi:hypothetical protein